MACESRSPAMPGETVLSIRALNFFYGNKQTLFDINLDVPAGRITGLLGPNGSGKTTLFRCCLNFLKPSSGRINLFDKPISSFTPAHFARHVAYVPQQHQLIFPFAVREVVEMGRNPHKGPGFSLSRQDREVVDHVMDRVGIAHLGPRPYSTLSGGQRQLALIARALAQSAELILLDEPTSSLDFSNQLTVWETLISIAANNVGIIICCHDPNHILWFCDNSIVLKQGRVQACGTPAQTLTQSLLQDLYGRRISMAEKNDGEQPFIYVDNQRAK
jgi:iron complex transport system ATP-binding protein